MAGIVQVPSAWEMASTAATWSPTRRSAWTSAPATGPFGPDTVPDRLAPPGPAAIAVVGGPATAAIWTPARLPSVVGVVVAAVGGGVGYESVPTWPQPAATTPMATRSAQRALPALLGVGPGVAPALSVGPGLLTARAGAPRCGPRLRRPPSSPALSPEAPRPGRCRRGRRRRPPW